MLCDMSHITCGKFFRFEVAKLPPQTCHPSRRPRRSRTASYASRMWAGRSPFSSRWDFAVWLRFHYFDICGLVSLEISMPFSETSVFATLDLRIRVQKYCIFWKGAVWGGWELMFVVRGCFNFELFEDYALENAFLNWDSSVNLVIVWLGFWIQCWVYVQTLGSSINWLMAVSISVHAFWVPEFDRML
jgi:hypothetical protein